MQKHTKQIRMKTKRKLRYSKTARPEILKDIISLPQPVIAEKSAIPGNRCALAESRQDSLFITDWVPCKWFEKLIVVCEQNANGIKH